MRTCAVRFREPHHAPPTLPRSRTGAPPGVIWRRLLPSRSPGAFCESSFNGFGVGISTEPSGRSPRTSIIHYRASWLTGDARIGKLPCVRVCEKRALAFRAACRRIISQALSIIIVLIVYHSERRFEATRRPRASTAAPSATLRYRIKKRAPFFEAAVIVGAVGIATSISDLFSAMCHHSAGA